MVTLLKAAVVILAVSLVVGLLIGLCIVTDDESDIRHDR